MRIQGVSPVSPAAMAGDVGRLVLVVGIAGSLFSEADPNQIGRLLLCTLPSPTAYSQQMAG